MRWSRATVAVLLTAALALTVWRAATLAVTHDEALTYNWFLSAPGRVLQYEPNNHVAFTYLALVSTSLFGATGLALRLPSLAATLVALAAIYYLCTRNLRGLWSPLAAGLVVGNPLVLDFLLAARGYALSLAALLVALCCGLAAIMASRRRASWLWIEASLALGIAVAANLASVVSCTSVAATLAFMSLRGEPRPHSPVTVAGRFVILTLPGALMALGLLLPFLNQIGCSAFYSGHANLGDWLGELLGASLLRSETAATAETVLSHSALVPMWQFVVPPVAVLAASAVLIGLVAIALPLGTRLWREGVVALAQNERAAFLCASVACLTLAGHLLLHCVMAVPYPPARAAIHAIPLVTFGFLFALGGERARRRWPGRTLLLAGAVLLARYVTELYPAYLWNWRYDAGSRAIFVTMENVAATHALRAVVVGGDWIFEPAMNFYRATRRAGWMAPYRRRAGYQQTGAFDFIVFDPTAWPDLERHGFRTLYQDPVSDAALAVRRDLLERHYR